MNIDTMPVKALRELKDRIDTIIDRKMETEKAELRNRFAAMAKEAGVTLDEIAGKPIRRRRSAGAVRYRDSKTGVLWAGRGRYPANFRKDRAVAV